MERQLEVLSYLGQILHSEQHADVTICCQSQKLQAHRILLSASSPFLQKLLLTHPSDDHVTLIVDGVHAEDMAAILVFAYTGQVSVDKRRFPRFLRAAALLDIEILNPPRPHDEDDFKTKLMKLEQEATNYLDSCADLPRESFLESMRRARDYVERKMTKYEEEARIKYDERQTRGKRRDEDDVTEILNNLPGMSISKVRVEAEKRRASTSSRQEDVAKRMRSETESAFRPVEKTRGLARVKPLPLLMPITAPQKQAKLSPPLPPVPRPQKNWRPVEIPSDDDEDDQSGGKLFDEQPRDLSTRKVVDDDVEIVQETRAVQRVGYNDASGVVHDYSNAKLVDHNSNCYKYNGDVGKLNILHRILEETNHKASLSAASKTTPINPYQITFGNRQKVAAKEVERVSEAPARSPSGSDAMFYAADTATKSPAQGKTALICCKRLFPQTSGFSSHFQAANGMMTHENGLKNMPHREFVSNCHLTPASQGKNSTEVPQIFAQPKERALNRHFTHEASSKVTEAEKCLTSVIVAAPFPSFERHFLAEATSNSELKFSDVAVKGNGAKQFQDVVAKGKAERLHFPDVPVKSAASNGTKAVDVKEAAFLSDPPAPAQEGAPSLGNSLLNLALRGAPSHDCGECGQQLFPRRQLLVQHQRSHTSGGAKQYYYCVECIVIELVPSFSLLNLALRGAPSHDCGECRQQFPRRQLLVQHQRSHTSGGAKQYYCVECIVIELVPSFSLLNLALRGAPSHDCGECGQQFPRRQLLVQHQRSHTSGGAKQYYCVECSEQFAQRAPFVAHRKLHHPASTEHACQHCDKVFLTRASLKVHVRAHSGVKPYQCPDCSKEFSQLRNFKYHLSIHAGTNEFSTTCPECGKYFNDRGYLSSHMKIHLNRKEMSLMSPRGLLQYKCQFCEKSFNQRVAYNMHVRIHTGVKPHGCVHCSKSFSRKMLLKQHMRIHTGERPFTCNICNKAFADRSNMSLHMRLHSGIKPYTCAVCDKSFTKKHHLKTHMNFHMGVKPYSCDKCGLTFSQSSNMRTHHKRCSVGDQSAEQSAK